MALIKDHAPAGYSAETVMLRVVHAFLMSVVLAAAGTTFAAPSPDESRSRPETVKRRTKKPRVKKSRKPLIEPSRKKVSEKSAPASTPAPAPTPTPQVIEKVDAIGAGDPRWTDPLALRDPLFLSAEARRARVEAGVAEEEMRDVRK